MPAYLVLINTHGRPRPQRVVVCCNHQSADAAIARAVDTCPDWIADLDVELVSLREDQWFQEEAGRAA